MKFWPFSEISALQEALDMANKTNVQAVKNFDQVNAMLSQTRFNLEEAYLHMASYRSLITATDKQVAQLTADLKDTKSDLEITQKHVRAADESHMDTVAELEKKTQQFEQALDRITDMVKGDDGQAWKEAEKFLAQHRSTKNCVKCGSKMIELRGEDKKLCSNGACGHEVDWPLEEGQTYMYKNNVEPFIEDRSNVKEELEPAPSTRERL